jgi:hypothetical protein
MMACPQAPPIVAETGLYQRQEAYYDADGRLRIRSAKRARTLDAMFGMRPPGQAPSGNPAEARASGSELTGERHVPVVPPVLQLVAGCVLENADVGDWRKRDSDFACSADRAMSATTLEKIHLMPHDGRLVFEETEHKYTLDGRTVPRSVTAVVGKYHEAFDADVAVGMMRNGSKWSEKRELYLHEDGREMMDEEIKLQWSRNGQVQSGRGSLMHFQIEQHVNGVIIAGPHSPEFRQFVMFERQILCGKGYKPLRTEFSIFHEELRLAGQIDMLALTESGSYAIFDWKRTKKIEWTNQFRSMYPPLNHLPDSNAVHYTLQLNLYARMLRDQYGIRVTELVLGVFHPNQSEDSTADTYIPFPHYRRVDLPFWDLDPIIALEQEAARSYPE